MVFLDISSIDDDVHISRSIQWESYIIGSQSRWSIKLNIKGTSNDMGQLIERNVEFLLLVLELQRKVNFLFAKFLGAEDNLMLEGNKLLLFNGETHLDINSLSIFEDFDVDVGTSGGQDARRYLETGVQEVRVDRHSSGELNVGTRI